MNTMNTTDTASVKDTGFTDMGDDIFDPEAVIKQAKKSIQAIDAKLVETKLARDVATKMIKTLNTQREQMVRIAAADGKRKVTRAPKPAAFVPPVT